MTQGSLCVIASQILNIVLANLNCPNYICAPSRECNSKPASSLTALEYFYKHTIL